MVKRSDEELNLLAKKMWREVSRRDFLQYGALTGAGLFAALSGACSSTTTQPKAAETPSSGGQAPLKLSDATLRSGIGSDAGSYDPQSLAGTGGGNWPNTFTHFVNMLSTNPETNLADGNIAASFQFIEGGAKFEVKLRDGVTFHNGDPVDAENIKFTFDRALGKASYNPKFQSGASGQYTGVITDVEVVDRLTVRMHLAYADVSLPFKMGYNQGGSLIVPKNYIEKVGDDEFALKPVGCGPYQFVSRVADSEIKSQRFEKYSIPLDGKGFPRMSIVKNLVQKVFPENQARLAALQAGELDIIHNVSSDLARQLESDGKFQVIYLPDEQPMHIHINTFIEKDPKTGEPNPWRDKRVRQAANYAIDLDTIIKKILYGREKPSFGTSSRAFGFPDDLKNQRYKYDPAKAKQLLAEAGYANGFETQIANPTGRWSNSREVCEAIAGYLSAVGIKTTLQEMQYQVVTTKIKDKSLYPMTFWGMSSGPDPSSNLRNGYYSKGTYAMSTIGPEIDKMIEAQEREMDAEKRKKLIGDVIRQHYLDARWIFLHEPVSVVVMAKGWQWQPYEKVLRNPEYWKIGPV